LISEEYTFLAFSENVIGDTQRLLIFNTDGKLIAQKEINGHIVRLQCLGNEVFILTSGNIFRMKIFGSESSSCPIEKNSIDLILTDAGLFYLCYPGYSLAVNISDAFEPPSDPDPPETQLKQQQ
jgi:hypothetical protein